MSQSGAIHPSDGPRMCQASARRWRSMGCRFMRFAPGLYRLEGKAIAPDEHGEPGDFEFTIEEARKVLELGKYGPSTDHRSSELDRSRSASSSNRRISDTPCG